MEVLTTCHLKVLLHTHGRLLVSDLAIQLRSESHSCNSTLYNIYLIRRASFNYNVCVCIVRVCVCEGGEGWVKFTTPTILVSENHQALSSER